MSPAGLARPPDMTAPTQASTLTDPVIAMFTVTDQDAAKAFSCDVLGFEVRADVQCGQDPAHRWLEVAPPGSTSARLALHPPMGGTPGGGGIGLNSIAVTQAA
jgi:lactoylglutathione lyase